MERNINSLLEYSIEATDGEIGKVEDFYFDDRTWDIRYLIVKTGNWLSDRKVLIAPSAVVATSLQNGLFSVNLTKEQINNSPDIDTDEPVSRQQEIELYGHYQWENYWGSGFYAGGSMGISTPFPVMDKKVLIEADQKVNHAEDDPHLRSTERITGYHLHASDGDVGHVNDFILEEKTWQIKFIVVDTHNWFGGKKVLIPVGIIKKIEWTDFKVFLDMTMVAVEKCKLFEEVDFIHVESEKQ